MQTLADFNGTTNGAMTRREARESYQSRNGSALAKRRSPEPAPVQASVAKPSRQRRRLRGFANVFVLLAAAGIVGTLAIPAYAFNPSSQTHTDSGSAVVDTMKRADAQSADVSNSVHAPAVAHEGFQATSIADINAAKLEAQRDAAAKAAIATAASYSAAYTGPTAAQYLTDPAYPDFSLAKVFSVAQQYIGTPYVYGGSTPAGFDCSGFIMFVYAQFGISLPHSASAQGQMGTTIALSAAQPGDVIALNDGSHVGFYAGKDSSGNVLILDAPKPGGSVSIRPLWTTAYHIVRYGIS